MIRKIGFSNYKAFDKDEIELKPITILLGANSSGKSSLLQLLLLIEQTVNTERGYESALKLNGKYVGLGEVENIFKNRNTKKDLTLSVKIDSRKYSFQLHEMKRLHRNIESEIVDMYFQFKKIEQLSSNSKKEYEKIRRIRHNIDINEGDIEVIIKEIKRIKRKYSNFVYKEPSLFEDVPTSRIIKKSIAIQDKEYKKILETNIVEYYDAYVFLTEMNKHSLREFTIEYDISYSKTKNNLEVRRIAIMKDNTALIEYQIEKNQGHIKHVLKSDIINSKLLEKYRVKFGRSVSFDLLNLTNKSDESIDAVRYRRNIIEGEVFCTAVFRLFNIFTNHFNSAFDHSKINYISPLRAFPKRYYFLDESNVSSSLDSIDGDNLTETLKNESSVISKVNKWLNKFGLAVSVEDVKEVIHRLRVSQNGLNLDITDVGFGISQVLPIIVQGFLSKDDSLTIVEQPEIHLHPMMQAELADLFIDVICNETNGVEKTLLIETHSESILKRLRRRIAEGKIKNTDVAIYFVHGRKKKSSGARIERIEIGEKGAFDWPKEFYSTDFEDTNEFLKHQ